MYQMLTGREDPARAGLEMLYAVSDLLPMAPLNYFDASWAEIVPDAARPFAQIASNTNFMGSTIYNEWASDEAPGYTKAKTNKKERPMHLMYWLSFLKV